MAEAIGEWDACIGTTMNGDIIGSRRFWLQHGVAARRDLQRRLEDILDRGNQLFETIEPLQTSIGDEFQGAFVDWETAMGVGLWLRLQIQAVSGVDTRYGFCDGEFFYHPQAPLQQGPAWRESRAAIKHVRAWQKADPGDSRRSCFLSGDKGRVDAKAINSLSAVIDQRLETATDTARERLIARLEEQAGQSSWLDYHSVIRHLDELSSAH